jgi:hypothetical protein
VDDHPRSENESYTISGLFRHLARTICYGLPEFILG